MGLNVEAKTDPRRVGIATKNMRVYYRLSQEFKRKGIPFRSILPEDEIPDDVKVVITTDEEKPVVASKRIITVGRGRSYRLVVDRALFGPEEKDTFHEVIVGIDPGKRIGIATLADGRLIHSALLIGAERLRKEVNYVFWAFPSDRRLIRIGSVGSRIHLKETVGALEGLRWEAAVELVDERSTSQKLPNSDIDLPRDIVSAIQIASRLGKKLGMT